ncbi:MAG: hypothetical protein ACYC1M_17765 [Armatimonadota bacterium]
MNLLTSCFGRKILEAAKQALITHISEEVRRLVDKYAHDPEVLCQQLTQFILRTLKLVQ